MYCYLWKEVDGKTIENAPFPGIKMEKVEPKFETYGLNGVSGENYIGCIFSDGTNKNQTVNTFEFIKNPTRGFTYKITGKVPEGQEYAGNYNGVLVSLDALLEVKMDSLKNSNFK